MNALKAAAGGLVVAAGFLTGLGSAEAGPQNFQGGFGQSKFSGGFGNSSKFHGGIGHSSKFHGGFGHGSHFHGGIGLSGPFVPIHKHKWHDTSHYDYVPGRYVWNGFRWVYVPGHLRWHQDGHFHHFNH